MVTMTRLTGVMLCALILLFISGSVLHADEVSEAATPWIPAQAETSEAILARTTEINRPKEIGTYYAATVPDTLDLAERARLGISHFTLIQDESCEMYFAGGPAGAWPSVLAVDGLSAQGNGGDGHGTHHVR